MLLHNFPVAMGSAAVVERRLYAEHPELRFDMALSRSTAEDVLFGFQLLALWHPSIVRGRAARVHRRFVGTESRSMVAFLHVDNGRSANTSPRRRHAPWRSGARAAS